MTKKQTVEECPKHEEVIDIEDVVLVEVSLPLPCSNVDCESHCELEGCCGINPHAHINECIDYTATVPATIEDDGTHKCDTCSLEFATCESTAVVFGIDHNPEATGKEADRVVLCGAYVSVQVEEEAVPFRSLTARQIRNVSVEFNKDLPVPVPDHELADYGKEMARLQTLWVKTKLDAKAFAKSCKEITDHAEEDLLNIAQIIEAGTEERSVKCRWEFNYREGVKILRRMDTWEIVGKPEILQGDELNLTLDFTGVENLRKEQESDEEAEEEICNNIDCEYFAKDEPNGCSSYEHCHECETWIPLKAVDNLDVDQVNEEFAALTEEAERVINEADQLL